MLIGGLAAAALVALVTPTPAGDFPIGGGILARAQGDMPLDLRAPEVKVILPAERSLKAERPDVQQRQIYGGSGLAGPALGKVTMIGGKVREVHYRPGVSAGPNFLVPCDHRSNSVALAGETKKERCCDKCTVESRNQGRAAQNHARHPRQVGVGQPDQR